MIKPQMYKVKTMGQGFLAVMAKPVAGEWIEDEFLAIAQADIKQIVSLLEANEAYELGLQNEQKYTEKNHMEFISFPIKDRNIPLSRPKFEQLIQQLYQDITQGKNTVIHCRAGIGRTGMVAAAILMQDGFSVESACEKVSSKRGVVVPETQAQRDWLNLINKRF
jgi:protein-tyrosine phosphatase